MKIAKEKLKQIIKEELEAFQEQDDASSQIDKAKIEAQRIAEKLTSELEDISKKSGVNVATLSALVKQFMDQE